MNFDLDDKVAMVTGGGRGIGRAIAAELACGLGARVAVLDRNYEHALEVAAEIACGATGFRVDVVDPAAIESCVEAVERDLGPIEVLVNCAGITRDNLLARLSEESWDAVLDVNLKGSFAVARAAAPALRERKWGRIVLISSINGQRGKFGQANYTASKAGVIGLGKTLARELGRFGVTVNVVAPGMVATPMTASLPAEALRLATDESLLGRIADVADIAAAVCFLCSDSARHVTGAVLAVDGGQDL